MIGKDFIENTKYQYVKNTGQLEKKMPPPLQLPYNLDGKIILGTAKNTYTPTNNLTRLTD